jgi:hypothetical protein
MADVRWHDIQMNWKRSDEKYFDGFCRRCGLIGCDRKDAGKPACRMDKFWYQAERGSLREGTELGDPPPGMTDNLPI